MSADGFLDRLYPIGALQQREVAEIRDDPFCADPVSFESLMNEWRTKSEIFRTIPRESLDVPDSDIVPINVSPSARAKVNDTLSACRLYIPATYVLAFVPISKLVIAQNYVDLEYTRIAFDGLSRPLTDDENVEYCLGAPVRDAKIDGLFLGYPKGEAGQLNYRYQFSSEDQNIRYIPPMPLTPLRDLDISASGAREKYGVKAITIMVGPGLPFVHVLKVRSGLEVGTGKPLYRLITSNGLHRIFRLARLGNSHVAAMVQPLDMHQVPDPFIEAQRTSLFAPAALRVTDLVNGAITRSFKWRKTKRVIRLDVRVTQELSYVP